MSCAPYFAAYQQAKEGWQDMPPDDPVRKLTSYVGPMLHEDRVVCTRCHKWARLSRPLSYMEIYATEEAHSRCDR